MTDETLVHFSFEEAFRATSDKSGEKLSLYFPDRDQNNGLVPDVDRYVEVAACLMTDINGGVTKLPAAEGRYKSGEMIVEENTTILYSYIFDPESFQRRYIELVALLHKFGRETNQREVMFDFIGEADNVSYSRSYKISEYYTEAELVALEAA